MKNTQRPFEKTKLSDVSEKNSKNMTEDWSHFEKEISEYSGYNIKLIFELEQDKSEAGSGAGWLIDDIIIKKLS